MAHTSTRTLYAEGMGKPGVFHKGDSVLGNMIPVSPGQSSNAYSNYDEGKVFLICWGSDLMSLYEYKENKGEGKGF